MRNTSNGPPGGSGGRGPNDNKKDTMMILFSENWKQQVMVKRDARFKALTGVTLSMEFMASMALLFMAMENVSLTLSLSYLDFL